eukprot:1377873-Amorphochlora_amoeboformis.AAC.1
MKTSLSTSLRACVCVCDKYVFTLRAVNTSVRPPSNEHEEFPSLFFPTYNIYTLIYSPVMYSMAPSLQLSDLMNDDEEEEIERERGACNQQEERF